MTTTTAPLTVNFKLCDPNTLMRRLSCYGIPVLEHVEVGPNHYVWVPDTPAIRQRLDRWKRYSEYPMLRWWGLEPIEA
jgi:hypothetical protein